MNIKGLSISKFEANTLNEDAYSFGKDYLAVSDGAGGGGIFAERWSDYLSRHLSSTPILSFDELNSWIEAIWEEFYNEQEEEAKKIGGMILQKFYDEGSFATLAASWMSNNKAQWLTYGDSVVFHYNRKTKKLEHSFSNLSQFSDAPYLINWKDEPVKEGFKQGTFCLSDDSILFIASDTLSQYILMMYLLCNHSPENDADIIETIHSPFKLSKNVRIAKNYIDSNLICFEQDILNPLIGSLSSQVSFSDYIKSLYEKEWLGHDDYSLVVAMNDNITTKKYKRIPRKLKKRMKKQEQNGIRRK